jgi:hypothetical protein
MGFEMGWQGMVCLYVCLYSHNSSLGGRRSKPIGALNSAGIGEGAELKKIQNFFLKNLRSKKS